VKYANVEEVLEIFPHPILPLVQGEPDYNTIHAIRKLLQANARAIYTHLGGGALGHLGITISEAAYTIVAPTGENGVKLLPLPQPPLRARTDARANPNAQRATQLRSVLARMYTVARQNQITTTVT
jgi:hypothetical protein